MFGNFSYPVLRARDAKTGWRFAVRDWPVSFLTGAVAIAAVWVLRGDYDLYLADHRAIGLEAWRHLSSTLVHVDARHLLSNVFWLSVLGYAVETRIGSLRTLALILLFAVVASAASYAWDAPGVGLSGVVYGLFGLLFVQAFVTRRWKGAIGPMLSFVFAAGGLLAFKFEYHGYEPAHVAHAAGLASGALLALPIGAQRRTKGLAALPAIGLLSVVTYGALDRALADARLEHAFAALLRAEEAMQLQDFEKVRTEASTALATGALDAEQRAWAWNYRATAEASLGAVDESGRGFLEAFELAPSLMGMRENLRWWLTTRRAASTAALDRAIDAFTQREAPEALSDSEAFAAGWLHWMKGDRERALAMFLRAVQLEPHVAEYRESLRDLNQQQSGAGGGR